MGNSYYSITSSANKPPTGPEEVAVILLLVSALAGLFTLTNVNESVTRATAPIKRIILVFIRDDFKS
jgi:hypothetical protein